MLLTYLDESYTDRWYWMDALLVPDVVAILLSTALDEVMLDAAKAYGVAAESELHGYGLFQGRAPWTGLPPRARIAVYNSALRVIGSHEVTIILRGVDRHGLTRRYATPKPAHEVVLSHLLERIDGYAAMREQLVLVIADEVDNPATHRSNLSLYRAAGTGGCRAVWAGGQQIVTRSSASCVGFISTRERPPPAARQSGRAPGCRGSSMVLRADR